MQTALLTHVLLGGHSHSHTLLTQSCQQREHAAFRNVIFHRLAIMMVLLVCFFRLHNWCFITENAHFLSAVVPNREQEYD